VQDNRERAQQYQTTKNKLLPELSDSEDSCPFEIRVPPHTLKPTKISPLSEEPAQPPKQPAGTKRAL